MSDGLSTSTQCSFLIESSFILLLIGFIIDSNSFVIGFLIGFIIWIKEKKALP